MRLGILQAGVTPDDLIDKHGSYADMFIQLLDREGPFFEYNVYTVCDNEMPQSVDECDGWLMTGSKFSAYDDLGWIAPLEIFVRDIHRAKLPLIGVCFGHQLIAQALGGRVEKSVKGWGLGLDTYHFSEDSPLQLNGDNRCTLHIFHQDQVVELPPETDVYAQSEFCEYAGLSIGDKTLTIQAHPEFPDRYNYDLLQARKLSVVPEALANAAMLMLDQSDRNIDSARFGRWMSAFLRSE